MPPLPTSLQSPLQLQPSVSPPVFLAALESSYNFKVISTALITAAALVTFVVSIGVNCAIMAHRRSMSYTIDLFSDEESDFEVKPKTSARGRPKSPVILDEEDQEAIDLTGEDDDVFIRELSPNELKAVQSKKSDTLSPGFRQISHVVTKLGVNIAASTDVELKDGDFLRVVHIYQHDFTKEVILKGILLRRTRRTHRYFKKNRNELCVILQQIGETDDPAFDSSLATRPLEAVLQKRQIVFTNHPFYPHYDFSFRHDAAYAGASNQSIEETAVLVCRSKYIECCEAAPKGKVGKVTMTIISNLSESEADKGKAMSDIVKKNRWLEKDSTKQEPRSASMNSLDSDVRESIEKNESMPAPVIDLTGAVNSRKKRRPDTIDLTKDDEEETITKIRKTSITDTKRTKNGSTSFQRREQKTFTKYTTVTKPRASSSSSTHTFGRDTPTIDEFRYTFGDICTGGGGMTRGAAEAGLVLNFLLDHWPVACATLRKNWPRVKVIQADIFSFCVKMSQEMWMRVDILHISFPCQTHSLAHTVEGKDDEANEASALSVVELLEKCRPRVVTFEQTWSILCARRLPHFQALIRQLTTLGYNVRWKIHRCSEYGNVQPRKRLFVIASW